MHTTVVPQNTPRHLSASTSNCQCWTVTRECSSLNGKGTKMVSVSIRLWPQSISIRLSLWTPTTQRVTRKVEQEGNNLYLDEQCTIRYQKQQDIVWLSCGNSMLTVVNSCGNSVISACPPDCFILKSYTMCCSMIIYGTTESCGLTAG